MKPHPQCDECDDPIGATGMLIPIPTTGPCDAVGLLCCRCYWAGKSGLRMRSGPDCFEHLQSHFRQGGRGPA